MKILIAHHRIAMAAAAAGIDPNIVVMTDEQEMGIQIGASTPSAYASPHEDHPLETIPIREVSKGPYGGERLNRADRRRYQSMNRKKRKKL